MKTPHQYEEREAEELRREELAEYKRRFLPPRTTDQIVAEARKACSDMDDEESTVTCMLGYLAKEIEILESGMDNLRQLNNDLEAERRD